MGIGDPEASGRELARLRIAAGLSARQLAEKAGVSHSAVFRAERGRSIAYPAVVGLARVLGPSVYEHVAVWPPGDGPIIDARRLAGETRPQAAKRAGVTTGVLARAERGERVHPNNAKRIATAFGLRVEDVLSIPTEKTHDPEAV
jgi:transcriptional regulator with XRE-family HTH domain